MQLSISLVAIFLFLVIAAVRDQRSPDFGNVETAMALMGLFVAAMFAMLLLWLAVDAFILPRMVRERNRRLEVRILTHLSKMDASVKRLNDNLTND